MFRLSLARVLALVLVLFAATVRTAAADDDSAGSPPGVEPAWQKTIDQALQKSVSLKVVETPLEEVVPMLSKTAGVPNLLLDERAMADVGLGADTPITIELNEVSLRTVLKLMLGELDLTYVVRDGALVITTHEEAETELVAEIFDVLDLVRQQDDDPPSRYDSETLINLITTVVAPQTWDVVGGAGSIDSFRGTLVVSQTREQLNQIRQLLEALRQARQVVQEQGTKPPSITSIDVGGPPSPVLEKALARKSDYQFDQTPLGEVVAKLRDSFQIAIWIDNRPLEDVGLGGDTHVSFSAKDISLRHALAHLLRPLDLTYALLDDVLLITTPEVADVRMQMRVYPVADLDDLLPRAGDPFGGGGFGGGMGGGGMGGGGMGGGGMGGGGMGGGMGGGFFSGGTASDYESLIELIQSTVAPECWDVVGGAGSLEPFDAMDLCVISQTPRIHGQIEDLLTKLREKLAAQSETADPKDEELQDKLRLAVYVLQPQPAVKQDNENETSLNTNASRLNAEELLEVVCELVEPESWTQDDVYARAIGGRLVIRQTEPIHRQIRQLLWKLGASFYDPSGASGGFGGGGMGGMGGSGGGFF